MPVNKIASLHKRLTYIIIIAFLAFSSVRSEGFSVQKAYIDQTVLSHVRSLIKQRVTEGGSPLQITINGDPIYASFMLEIFYKRKDFQPAWVLDDLKLEQAHYLVATIEASYLEGLTPEHYHLRTIKTLLSEVHENSIKKAPQDPEKLVDLDLLLTDAFLLLGCHFSAGCVNPVTVEAEWFTKQGKVDAAAVLEVALRENRIKETLQGLLPPQDSYAKLKQALNAYRNIVIKGGWPAIPQGPSLKIGFKDKRILSLRKRLILSGQLDPDDNIPTVTFDTALENAVKKFQDLHGLDIDGVVGPSTLKALNASAQARARQIELNLERMRWIYRNLGQRYIIVNIADFTLDVVENNKKNLSMKVVVGKPFWHTPVFSDKMTYIVLNPSWNVPHSIAEEETIPKIKKDPDYLAKHNMKILKGWSEDEETIDPNSIDWRSLDARNFKYRFRQEPGPLNPLGSIKFVFPNEFGVYLHDTPSKRLFAKSVRSFSHGCIRVEKPLDLAEYLLNESPDWTREKILAAIETGKEQKIRLPEPVDIHILYLTAWIDDGGLLHFRDDIYGRDERLDKSLRENPPRAVTEESQ
jgi:murein L,D-transpeptidase YcbB/YkuD